MDSTDQLAKILRESENIVFFGGAGVSTESGIPDFRSDDGLYNESGNSVPPETILSHDYFIHHEKEFWDYYYTKMIWRDAKPNAAHKMLARLESLGKLRAVVTQNIDGLHTEAGSRNVFELHGSVKRNYCLSCGKESTPSGETPRCRFCGGRLRPDVVLYDEALNDSVFEGAALAIGKADTLLVGGTSLTVYPAAGLIRYFRGNHFIIINKTPTPYDRFAELIIREPIGQTLAALNL